MSYAEAAIASSPRPRRRHATAAAARHERRSACHDGDAAEGVAAQKQELISLEPSVEAKARNRSSRSPRAVAPRATTTTPGVSPLREQEPR